MSSSEAPDRQHPNNSTIVSGYGMGGVDFEPVFADSKSDSQLRVDDSSSSSSSQEPIKSSEPESASEWANGV